MPVAETPQLSWHEVSPFVTYANYLPCQPANSFGPRIIQEYQFIFVASGKGSLHIQDRAYEAASGDLFYYGPGVPHFIQADSDEPFALYGVHFLWTAKLQTLDMNCTPQVLPVDSLVPPERQLNRIQLGLRPPESLALGDKQKLSSERMTPYFERMVQTYQSGSAFASLHLHAIMIELLIAIKQAGQYPALSRETAHPVVAVVADELDARIRLPYNRNWLNEWTAYHPDYVSRLFRDHTGWTPYHYFMHRKIEFAKQLLAGTDETIQSIADTVSASSVHAFTKWFAEHTGVPPGRFRKQSRLI